VSRIAASFSDCGSRTPAAVGAERTVALPDPRVPLTPVLVVRSARLVQCTRDVRPAATERFRIQFYAVCAARPLIEFRREQLTVGSAAAAVAATTSSCTVMNLNNSQLTTPR